MLRVFNDQVVSALFMFAAKHEVDAVLIDGTWVFINTILILLRMLNVKHLLKGRNLHDENCDPISSLSDHQF